MTTVVVPAELPASSETVAGFREFLPESAAESLYSAMLIDVCVAVQHGGADLLVNHPPADAVPDDVDPEARLRELLASHLPEASNARYERQVGETRAGRAGNAITHLLEAGQTQTAAVLEPTAPFVRREHLGNAAMSLRTSDVVIGPTADGDVYFAGFREPVDFEHVFDPPAVQTLAERARDEGLEVDFLPITPRVETEQELAATEALLSARVAGEQIVPAQTAAWLAEHENRQLSPDSSDRS